MTLKEKKIKDDILNEIEVPNVLNKVRPYAQEQSAEFDNKKIRHFGFARIFSASMVGLLGVLTLVVLISLGFGKNGVLNMSDSSKNYDALESASESGKSSETIPNGAQSDDNGKGDFQPESGAPKSYDDVYSYYLQAAPSQKITQAQVNDYYQEVFIYINEGKNFDEIAEIMLENDDNLSMEDLEIIYDYASDGD